MNFKKLMLSVGLSAMALLAMPGSTLTSPVSVQAAAHEHILETYITKQPTCTATGTEIRKCQTCGKITDTIKLPKVAHFRENKDRQESNYHTYRSGRDLLCCLPENDQKDIFAKTDKEMRTYL